MRWKQFFTSQPPSAGWTLDADMAAGLRRDKKGALHCTAASMPQDVFEVGPVGLSSVDADALASVLAPLQLGLTAPRRAAVIIPTAWLRCYLVDLEQIPRRRAEVDDVLRWRMKKLLPVPPSELRIAWAPSTTVEGKRRLLVMAGIERALASLEEALSGAGIDPGLITPSLFALLHGNGNQQTMRLTVQAGTGFLSTAGVRGGGVELVRTKPVPGNPEAWDGARTETHLILDFIRTTLGIEEPLEVQVVAETESSEASLRETWQGREGVVVLPPPRSRPCSEPGLAERLGGARLAPLYAVMNGAAE